MFQVLKITKQGEWPSEYSQKFINYVEDVITWKIPNLSSWYKTPGRTFYLVDEDSGRTIKVKGAGFFNPPNSDFSGIKRSINPIVESNVPQPPSQNSFRRDIVHVDPGDASPFYFQSIKSFSAPIGGMTLKLAKQDQHNFLCLRNAQLPSNIPLVAYMYNDMYLENEVMGVSISEVPENFLGITPYELYLSWYKKDMNEASNNFLEKYAESQSIESNNLNLISAFARKAGELLFLFSAKGNLFRFSASPDNFNIKDSIEEPLFFSDIDTARPLNMISPEKVLLGNIQKFNLGHSPMVLLHAAEFYI